MLYSILCIRLATTSKTSAVLIACNMKSTEVEHMGPQTCRPTGLWPKVQNREPVWVLYSHLNPHNARALHVTSRCICMSILSCERKGWTREGLICKCGEVCRYLFCKIAIVSFLAVRYKSVGLYCRMAGTPSSPTRLYCVKNNSVFYNYICYIYSPWFFLCIKLWYKRFVYFFTEGVSLCQKYIFV